jgi:hypothetical protein
MQKTKKKHLSDLHFEHQLWAMEGDFYRDELKIYQGWLEAIASKNTGEEVLKQVDHFQNQFIIQNGQLEMLTHEVKAHEQWLTDYAVMNPVAIDHQYFADHDDLRDNMETFKNIYMDLKSEFKRFAEERL